MVDLSIPAVTILEVSRPALVIGSTQPAAHVDADRLDAAGVDLCRRRSGGGAVLVCPGDLLWVDVVVPAGDYLWSSDVGRAFWWLGDVWVEALARLGVAGAEAHRGPLVANRWSGWACFAGLGPGEVSAAGAKVVGISQRRTRQGSLLQCAALLRWDPPALVELMALDPEGRRELSTHLTRSARAMTPAADRVRSEFLGAIGRR